MLYLADFYILYVLAFIAAILAIIKQQYPIASVLLIYASAGIFYYLKLGTVRKALDALRTGNLNKAKRQLNKTKITKHLEPEWKAYYHYIKGILAYNQNQLDEAFKHLQYALLSGYLAQQERELAFKIVDSLEKTANQA